MVDENIFREVDEELRRERYLEIWNKFGTLIIGGLSAIAVIALGGWYWWNSEISNRQLAGDTFIEAMRKSAKDDQKSAEIFERLIKSSPKSYKFLASLQLASSKAALGEKKEAAALYKKVADDPSADKIIAEYAALHHSMAGFDDASYEDTLAGLERFLIIGSIWRHTAEEVVALAALKDGKIEIAKERFGRIGADATAPSAIKTRAQIMLDVIAAKDVQ